MECHGPIVWRAAKHCFGKRGQGDLLVQELFVSVKLRGLGHIRFKNIVGGQIATVEGIEEIPEPGMGGRPKGLKNGMEQEFTEIVDGVRD